MSENCPSKAESALLKATIRVEVSGITPADAAEAQDITACLDWIDSGADLWRRVKPRTPPMHLVSYFCVLAPGKVLLGDHRSSGLWLPPGGHVEPEEHPRETVARECLEELGCSLPLLRDHALFLTVTETKGPDHTRHHDVSLWYAVQMQADVLPDFDQGEYLAMRWFACNDLPSGRMEPNLPRFLRKVSHLWDRQDA